VLQRVQAAPAVDGVVIRWVEQEHKVAPEADTPLRVAAWRRFKGSDASSIALFMCTELVKRIGGFDERFGVGQWCGAGEETDLLLRLLEQGAHIERLQTACVHHRFGQRFASRPMDEYRLARNRARGWGALCAKHRLPASTLLRGLFGPPQRVLVRRGGWLGVWRNAGVTAGRWQGYVAWCLCPPHDPHKPL
jgi:GT2 family glycosyltransferase